MPRDVALRVLAVAGAVTLLAACGKPPAPPRTVPPPPSGMPSTDASGPAIPVPGLSGLPGITGLPGLPGVPGATGIPGGTVPLNPVPTVPYVPYVPYVPPTTRPPVTTTRPATTAPTTPAVKGAAKCTSGPTTAQILAVLDGLPGIPDKELKVVSGPYCAGSWQFAEVQIAGADPKAVERLFVVTTGKPAALEVVEAGTDVCSTEVQSRAPAGIRVRACGA